MQQAPVFVGEFGLSPHKKGFDTYLNDFNQLADKYHMGWTYWASDPGGWGPYNRDKTPSPILPALLRVYPMATAGKLLDYSYQVIGGYAGPSNVFSMQFVSNAGIKAPTEIAIPPSLYPDGYNIVVSGPAKYHTSVNPVTNALLLFVEDEVPLRLDITGKVKR